VLASSAWATALKPKTMIRDKKTRRMRQNLTV
jgi:hypothetical protein